MDSGSRIKITITITITIKITIKRGGDPTLTSGSDIADNGNRHTCFGGQVCLDAQLLA